MNLYKSYTGVFVSLLLNFLLASVIMAFLFVLALKYDLSIYWVVGAYTVVNLVFLWRSIYQFSNASLVEREGQLFYHNGFRVRNIGKIESLRLKRVGPLGGLLRIEGDRAGMYCFKFDFPEIA